MGQERVRRDEDAAGRFFSTFFPAAVVWGLQTASALNGAEKKVFSGMTEIRDKRGTFLQRSLTRVIHEVAEMTQNPKIILQ